VAAGFVDFEITWKADVFRGAPQASSAAEFGTQGITFRARKAVNDQELHAATVSLACEVPIKPTVLLDANASLTQGAKASETLDMGADDVK
jgi:hypothetical protein